MAEIDEVLEQVRAGATSPTYFGIANAPRSCSVGDCIWATLRHANCAEHASSVAERQHDLVMAASAAVAAILRLEGEGNE